MADTALTFSVVGRDVRASSTLRRVGREADRTKSRIDRLTESYILSRAGMSGMAAAAVALGPALLPVVAASTVAVGGLSAAITAGGAALGVFGAVVITSFTKMREGVDAVRKAEEKLAKASTIKARATATKELAAAQKALVGPVGQGAKAYIRLGDAWKAFQKANERPTFAILARGMNLLAAVVPKLQPLFDVAARAVARFLTAAERAAKGGGLDRLVRFLAGQAGPALDSFGRSAANLGRMFGGLLRAFAPTSAGVTGGLERMTAAMARWANGPGVDQFILTVTQNGPTVAAALSNIAAATVALAKGLAPLGPVVLHLVGGLSALIAAAPPGVITGLAAAFIVLNTAMKATAVTASVAKLAMVAWSPWGIAIGVAAVALGIVAGKSAAAATRVRELTAAVQADSGALGQNTRAHVANTLQKNGTLAAANRLGISLKLVTDAALGDANAQRQVADAMDGVEAATDRAREAANKKGLASKELYEQGQREFADMRKLNGAIDQNSTAVRKASAAAANHAAAMGQTSVQARQNATAARAYSVQVGGLSAQINALKAKTVKVAASGAAGAATEVARLRAQIAALQGKVITIRTNRVDTIIETNRLSRTAAPRAAGGPVRVGGSYVVGERRPELFVPDRDGTIVPRVPTGMSAAGGNTYITIERLESNDPQRWLAELNRLARRNGGTLGLQGA